MPSTSPGHHRFHFLDALRGLAAILIISGHAPNAFGHSLIFHNAFMAVDFFFCLSGFVIAFSYEKRLTNFLGFVSFAITRMIRFIPIAALGTLLGAMTVLVSHVVRGYTPIPISRGTAFTDILMGFFILPHVSFVDKNIAFFPLDGVMWTLFFEIIANLFYAALVRFHLARTSVIFLISALSLLLLILECHLSGDLNYGYSQATFFLGLARVGFSFFAGVLIYRLYTYRDPSRLHGQQAIRASAFITALFVIALCNPLRLSHTISAELLAVGAAFPLIVYFGAKVVLPKHWTAICATLGAVSYPLYLLHPPLVWFLTRMSYIEFGAAHPFIATLIMLSYLSFLIFIAWICAEFYDAPIRRRLTNLYRARSSALVAA